MAGKSETTWREKSEEIGKTTEKATWWFRDLYTQICIYTDLPFASPRATKKKERKEKWEDTADIWRGVLGRPRIHNGLKLYPTHARHTYTSTSQSRDHVIMSELGNNFAWSTRPRRSTIDSAPIVPCRFSFFDNNCPPTNPHSSRIPVDLPRSKSIHFPFFFPTTIKDTRLYVYASHLFNISLSDYFSTSHLLYTASTISRACNGDLFAAHDVHILSRR